LAEDDSRDVLAVRAVAPTPALGRGLSLSKLAATLRRHGRQRNLAPRAQEIQGRLRAPQLDLQRPRLIAAHGDEVASLTRVLLQVRQELAQLEAQMAAAFRGHPDAQILLSFTGLADILAARELGETGDDRTRAADPTARWADCTPACATARSMTNTGLGRPTSPNVPLDPLATWDVPRKGEGEAEEITTLRLPGGRGDYRPSCHPRQEPRNLEGGLRIHRLLSPAAVSLPF